MIGSILGGRYEILEEIGKGGMAIVYKARCTFLNRIVAVKVLRDDLEGGEEFLKRFNIEAQAAASLSHPNIVSIFDIGVDHECHYIIMEYIDGITLKEYIAKKGRLNYKEAFNLAYQISDALQAAHSKNIVHRDIKPHNIMITTDGQIKVTDFGIARAGNGKTISTNNDILGSVHYISPEQARGEYVDNRTDIYSLGVVIYEMLTGRVPFDCDSPVGIAMKQIRERPADIISPEVSVPIAVQQLVFKAMSKDPDIRYQNSGELKADIRSILDNPHYQIPHGDVYTDIDQRLDEIRLKKHEAAEKAVSTKVRGLLMAFAIISSLFLVSLGVFVANNNVFSMIGSLFTESKIDVPSLTGLKLETAQSQCSELGLEVVVEDEITDEDAKPGTIISQSPRSGSKLKKGDTIKVTMNKHNTAFTLSDYVGRKYTDVEKELEEKGITVNVLFEESEKSTDVIIRQSPKAGVRADEKSTLTIYVSKGLNNSSGYITVPNLVGKTYAQCKSALTALGLSVGNITGNTHPENTDIVLAQAIPVGSMVKKGCLVGITIQEDKKVSPESSTDKVETGSDQTQENTTQNGTESTDKTESGTTAETKTETGVTKQ